MITANVALGSVGREDDLGDHQFVCLPRVGEQFLTNFDSGIGMVEVTHVFHYPRRAKGPDRDPLVVLRVKRVER